MFKKLCVYSEIDHSLRGEKRLSRLGRPNARGLKTLGFRVERRLMMKRGSILGPCMSERIITDEALGKVPGARIP
jgi:hypothetical protein